ncbi:MAG: hypothetical protein NZ108_10165, partial [Bacteroidia bacterium]|nr:hypothetical protein [Bacteroidia bacterium]
ANCSDDVGGMEILPQIARNQLPMPVIVGDQTFAKMFREAALIDGIEFRVRQASSCHLYPLSMVGNVKEPLLGPNFYRRTQ